MDEIKEAFSAVMGFSVVGVTVETILVRFGPAGRLFDLGEDFTQGHR